MPFAHFKMYRYIFVITAVFLQQRSCWKTFFETAQSRRPDRQPPERESEPRTEYEEQVLAQRLLSDVAAENPDVMHGLSCGAYTFDKSISGSGQQNEAALQQLEGYSLTELIY